MKVYLDARRSRLTLHPAENPIRRCHRVARILLAAVVLLVAGGSRAASLLLPVTTGVPPFNLERACQGLQVRDADSAVLLRSFPELGCVRTVASFGERRAIVVSGARPNLDRADDAARLVDLDDGTVLATLALNPAPGFYVLWVRALSERAFLVGMVQSSNRAFQTRFVRLDFDGTRLTTRADATVPGFSSGTDLGDVLVARRTIASGVAVDQYRSSDLSALGSVVIDQPAGITSVSAEVRGDRMYALVQFDFGNQAELRVIDTASGALIRRRPWPANLVGGFSNHDDTGRLLTVRYAAQPKGGYLLDLVAVGLDDGVETPLGSWLAPSPSVSVSHRDGRTVLLAVNPGLCTQMCSSDAPLDYAITSGPQLRTHGGEPMLAEPNSTQFLAPTLATGGADAVPASTPAGLALLVLALLALAERFGSGRGLLRGERRTPRPS